MIDPVLARRRLRALYRLDWRGRLVSINEWSAGIPPRLHILRTGSAVIVRTRNDVGDDVALRLLALAKEEPAALTERPALTNRYLAVLNAKRFRAGPVFVFPTNLPAPADVVEIGPNNADLLQGALASWRPDIGKRGPFLAIAREGRALALCASVRITPHVHCAGVETDPEFRGKGLASGVVAAWAARVRALGVAPFYSTGWDNLASRGVARRLGLQFIAVDFSVD